MSQFSVCILSLQAIYSNFQILYKSLMKTWHILELSIKVLFDTKCFYQTNLISSQVWQSFGILKKFQILTGLLPECMYLYYPILRLQNCWCISFLYADRKWKILTNDSCRTLSGHFFAICVFIFHKNEVPTCHFEVLNGSKSWLGQKLWPQM